MNLNVAKEIMVNRANAFHDRYYKAFGQLILKLDDYSYLMSRDNLKLNTIDYDDLDEYDISAGGIGEIFSARPEINAMVFMCTENSVKYSSEHDILRPSIDDVSEIVGGTALVSEDSTAANLIAALADRNGCFIKGVGILGVGKDIEEAIAAVRILEKAAECEIYGKSLGGPVYIDEEKVEVMRDRYRNHYTGVNADEHVPLLNYEEAEFRLRNEIIECGKKMSWDDLVQGSMGNISARLDDEYMLVTPSGMDYFNIRIEDIVKVNYNTLEYDEGQRKPTSEMGLHAALYRTYPDAGAAIHTHSNACTVFAASRAGFMLDQPELSEVIGDLKVTEYQSPGTEEFTLSVMTGLYGSHSCLIANHGAMFYGRELELVLAIANAVEAKACNLLGFGSIPSESEE